MPLRLHRQELLTTVDRVQLQRVTWAVDDLAGMVAFLNGVFDAGLEPIGNGPFYQGSFLGMSLVLCPNEIADVDARQNRHQFRVAVSDVDATVATVLALGGRVLHDDTTGGHRLVGIADPDGNTYELT